MIPELASALSRYHALKPNLTIPSAVARAAVEAERAALLIKETLVAAAANVAGAALAVAVLAASASLTTSPAPYWAALLVLVAGVRFGVWVRAGAGPLAPRRLRTHGRVHAVGMLVSAAAWGALPLLFLQAGALNHPALPLLAVSIAAVSVATSGGDARLSVFSLALILGPLSVAYGLRGSVAGEATAVGVVLIGLACGLYALRSRRGLIARTLAARRDAVALAELERANTRLEKSEQLYRSLVEATTDATIILCPEGEVLYASPAVERITGFSAEALVGMTTRSLFHPDDYATFRAAGAHALARLSDPEALPPIRLRRADGGWTQVHGSLANMLYIPGVEGFVLRASVADKAATHHLRAV